MATTYQQPRVFDDAEAQTLAGLWAGWETVNANEAEAMNKGRALRRKAAEKNLRVIDMLELPEIRAAVDAQLSPTRSPCATCTALDAELEKAHQKLADREKQTRKLIDDYEAKLKEKARAARQHTKQHRGIGEFLGFAWGYPEWRMAVLLALILGKDWLLSVGFFARHAWMLLIVGVLLLLGWAAAEIDETGWGPLLLKLGLLICGFEIVENARGEPIWIVVTVMALLTATHLVNNLCDRAKRVPLIAAAMEFFQ